MGAMGSLPGYTWRPYVDGLFHQVPADLGGSVDVSAACDDLIAPELLGEPEPAGSPRCVGCLLRVGEAETQALELRAAINQITFRSDVEHMRAWTEPDDSSLDR